jgi:hypothetical protein
MCGLPGTFDPEFPKELSLYADCQKGRFGIVARSFGIYEGALARAVLLPEARADRTAGCVVCGAIGGSGATRGGAVCGRRGVSSSATPATEPGAWFLPGGLVRAETREANASGVPAGFADARGTAEAETSTAKRGCWEAIRGAFAMRRGGRVDNLRILLLDDVMPTGATLDACLRALREAGAKSVLGLTVARASHPVKLLRRTRAALRR